MQRLQVFLLVCIVVYALISVLPHIAIIKQNHKAIYNYIKGLKYGSQYIMWWYMFLIYNHPFLPFYMDIPFSQYRLAIWQSSDTFSTMRITLRFREDNAWVATIKGGGYERMNDLGQIIPEKRISKHFTIFGFKIIKQ